MTALIVDDERIAREELRRLLAAHPECEVIGEAKDGVEAVAMIRKLAPELVFLDIQMPGAGGFDVLGQLTEAPKVIFTTAYDKYALKAFEVNALDYLLKPVDPARLAEALARMEQQAPAAKPERIFVRDGERCWLVRWADVFLLESEGNYTRLYFAKERPLVAKSLVSLEARLDGSIFFRADRKRIVNLRAIAGVEPAVDGSLVLKLETGQRVEMSRRQSARLKEMMAV
jgi:two-component system LytT family response regulator